MGSGMSGNIKCSSRNANTESEEHPPFQLAKVMAHEDEVNCIAVSTDLSMLATGSEDCSIGVWNEHLEFVRRLLGHVDYIISLAFTGKALLSASADTTVRKWNLMSGDCIFVIRKHEGLVTQVLASSSLIFSTSSDHFMYAWHPDTGSLIRTYNGHKGAVYGMKLMLTGDEDEEVAVGCRRRARMITYSDDCTAKLWAITKTVSVQTFSGHLGPILAVALDVDNHFLYTASADNRIASWLLETGQRIHWFEGHSAPVVALSLSGDYLYSASSDKSARAWVTDLAQEVQHFKRHQHTVFQIETTKDMLITACGDGFIRCFDPTTAAVIRSFKNPNNAKINCFKTVRNKLFVASQDGNIYAWDLDGLNVQRKKSE